MLYMNNDRCINPRNVLPSKLDAIFITLQIIFIYGLERLLRANITKNNSTPMNHTQPNFSMNDNSSSLIRKLEAPTFVIELRRLIMYVKPLPNLSQELLQELLK